MRLLIALAFTLLVSEASAQSRFYDASGRSVGTASTDSQGTTTFYDASGKVTARASKSGNTTMVYDAYGRKVGQATSSR